MTLLDNIRDDLTTDSRSLSSTLRQAQYSHPSYSFRNLEDG